MQILALVIATLIPLIVLYIIYTLDLYKTGNLRWVFICFVWGGAAFFTASLINRAFYFQAGWSADNIARFAAPVIEELLKATLLIYLVRRPNFTYFVDGAIYGFAVGMGFAICENYQYILANAGLGLGVAISRVLSANLIHASATALVGVALGLARFRKSISGFVAYLLLGLSLAILLHGIFNNLVTRLQGGLILLLSAVIGFAAAGSIAYLILRGLAEEKKWIEEKLGTTDRVTASEARVVHQLSNIQEILAPLNQRFGDEKVAQIESFLTLQARLGILRKTLDKLTDEKMRKAVEVQIGGLRTEMDRTRRRVGAYTMLYLRNIFPENASPLWGRLENLIQERLATRPVNNGPSVWANLGQKVTKPKDIRTRMNAENRDIESKKEG